MKDFMMIFVGADYAQLGLSPEQMQERMGQWFAWASKMQEAGIVKSGEALQNKTTTIKGKERLVLDGPLVESKEIIGGFYVVSAKNVEEVIEIAQDFPDYDLGGSVEIREVVKFE